ncbi:unnamed protein product [Chrysoparadoxa australica]
MRGFKEILTKHFKHQRFSSFQRQLNLYGFRKLVKGREGGCYFHPYFVRGAPALLKDVKRGVMPPCPARYEKRIYGSSSKYGNDASASDSELELRPKSSSRKKAKTRDTGKPSETVEEEDSKPVQVPDETHVVRERKGIAKIFAPGRRATLPTARFVPQRPGSSSMPFSHNGHTWKVGAGAGAPMAPMFMNGEVMMHEKPLSPGDGMGMYGAPVPAKRRSSLSELVSFLAASLAEENQETGKRKRGMGNDGGFHPDTAVTMGSPLVQCPRRKSREADQEGKGGEHALSKTGLGEWLENDSFSIDFCEAPRQRPSLDILRQLLN